MMLISTAGRHCRITMCQSTFEARQLKPGLSRNQGMLGDRSKSRGKLKHLWQVTSFGGGSAALTFPPLLGKRHKNGEAL
jgi:hypothetical protein